MADPSSQLSALRRPKWLHITMGVVLIVVAVALTVGWQILGATEERHVAETSTLRWLVYFFGTLLFLLLIGGLVLILVLLVREVRLNERQSNFISAVTHELKTPVASLKLYLDTLQMRDLRPDQRADFYRTMEQDLERLHGTINNVLNAARYTDRRVEDPRPVDLARLVVKTIELTRVRNQLPEESFSYTGPVSLTVMGDAGGLETAVLNLLDNAVKYSRDRIQVEVSLHAPGDGQACLRVRDQGLGMSRAHLRFIFNRFYRIGAEVRRSHTGTGLGLFIVKSVVKAHRGTVTAESAGPDRGSQFTITLPGVVERPIEGGRLEEARGG
jgi:two-component system sensor histidine kinase SenX3